MSEQYLQAGERLDDLRRNGLRLIQHPALPRFALDAVLLADFCRVQAGGTVADLGTGTGVIALLLAAKQPDCRIRAVEIAPRMADMARRSVTLNGLSAQIEVVEGDLRESAKIWGRASCRVVVSNPPYYAAQAGRVNNDPLAAAARSELYCTIDDVAREAAALLQPRGSLFLIHRAARFAEVMSALFAHKLWPQTIRPVQPFADQAANLFLVQALKGGRGESVLLPPLVVYQQQGVYSKEMEEIYG